MPGLSIRLPMIRDPSDGFALTQSYHELAAQNFKMLILTNPGERIMDPQFGVGIRNFLFEPNVPEIREVIETRVINQTARYLSYIDVLSVEFDSYHNNPLMDPNYVALRIVYRITPIDLVDTLELVLGQ
jgi:phage baseplate assembly protein W